MKDAKEGFSMNKSFKNFILTFIKKKKTQYRIMITINKMHMIHTSFSIFPEQIEIMRVVQRLKCHESKTLKMLSRLI